MKDLEFGLDFFDHNSIDSKRGMNKIGLETYTHNFQNVLDSPIDKLIKESEMKVIEISKSIEKVIYEIENFPEESNEYNKNETINLNDLNVDLFYHKQDRFFIIEELFALFEMKIIYSFKHLEINIKKLINVSYQDKAAVKIFQFQHLSQFFNTKGIILKDVDCFKEINQLRLINNLLKHSDDYSNVKDVKEFKNAENINYQTLKKFYNRVNNSPIKFLSSLSDAIYKDLYKFDKERLEEMAKSLSLRLENNDSKIFIDALKKNYN